MKAKCFLTINMLLILHFAMAQDPNERGNLTNYYHERLNFGVSLSVTRGSFLIFPPEHFERFDSLKSITSTTNSGFCITIVSELMLHKYVTLRFLPAYSFTERSLNYYFEGKKDTTTKIKNIESAFINFPIDFKLRSKRVKNFGAYILAGGGYSLDLASKRKVDNTGVTINDQIVKLKQNSFFYEGGAGAEFYLQYFKLAIEAKLSMSATNMLIKDGTIFSDSIDKLKSRILSISITFEG